jgi:L-amino acid N-acyltransferase YncA
MVVTRTDRDGNPRAEVKQGDTAAAVAGVNWVSPIFAEVFVQVQPDSRKRGWGRAVVRALCAELLKRQVTPLYSVAEDNDDSFSLADDVGFVETGAREIMTSITGR